MLNFEDDLTPPTQPAFRTMPPGLPAMPQPAWDTLPPRSLDAAQRNPGTATPDDVAHRRATQIGLDELYPGAGNPFPWMAEMIDLKKEMNFFETRVTEYQTGGALAWD